MKLLFTITLLVLSFSSTAVYSAQQIKVGVFECPPFVIKNDDNTYSGLSMLLWQNIAEQLKLEYTVESHDLDELLEEVSNGQIDVGVSCLTITPERETILDFSHSFYETHLAITVKKQGPLTVIKNILTNRDLLKFLFAFLGAACVIGLIYYLLEHKVNDKFYRTSSGFGKIVEGFLLGLLCVTKGPLSYHLFNTIFARILTIFLAILTTFFIASITAILASSLTLQSLGTDIKSPHDLSRKKVGAIAASVSSELLRDHNIKHQTYNSTEAMLSALNTGEAEAIVGDDAVLKYQIKKEKAQGRYLDFFILPYPFKKQNYGFALKDESPYEEKMNQTLLKFRKSEEWERALDEYLTEE